MGIVSRLYRKQFVCRYDKEVGVPYYSYLDFKGLHQESYSFNNSKDTEIHYFYYYYDNFKQDKIILFCHGIGPGHTSYLAEIETLARRGYKVLTLDYTGCGESKGDLLGSLNAPTRDVMELLSYLKIEDKQIILMGHSLGGYTALNVINRWKSIHKAILLSPFLDIKSLSLSLLKSRLVTSRILAYEKKEEPGYFNIDNIEYLKNTSDSLFVIQSEDDQMVPYSISLKVIEEINNPHIKTLRVTNRKHNPNYTDDAVNYMNAVFGKYNLLIKNKEIKTDEEKINYFKDVSLERLVKQDEKMFDDIIEFIEK